MESHLDLANNTKPADVPPALAPSQRTLKQPRRDLRMVFVILSVVAAIGLWWVLRPWQHGVVSSLTRDEQPTAETVQVTAQPVRLTTSPVSLEATGTVRSELTAPVASKVMGRLQHVLVREGERVRQGQTLIVLDARDLDAAIARANADLRSSAAGFDNARVAARMETSLSAARIAQARAKVGQSDAALQAATAKLELVQAGPRRQEREQAVLTVSQARSNLVLAGNNLKRMSSLYKEGAISAQHYDQYQYQYDVAKSQFETAQQGKSIVEEGSRAEDVRAAEQSVVQARAALQEAYAGLKSAQASDLLTDVRKQEIQGAKARIGQSEADLAMARVTRSYAVIVAPFAGVVTDRLADAGAMASPGVPLLKVAGGALRLEAIVPESALAAARMGAPVPVRFDALHDRVRTARVVEVAPTGDAGSHTFVVKLALPADIGAKPGMFGRARFVIGAEKRLMAPTAAVFEREGLHYVYVADDHRIARLRMITVGSPAGPRIPVLSGLNPDERVVTAGRERVTDGSPIAEESR